MIDKIKHGSETTSAKLNEIIASVYCKKTVVTSNLSY